MSRAFVKEDIDPPSDLPRLRRTATGLPPGAQNLITADGAQTLRTTLETLRRSTSATDHAEAAHIEHLLASATIVHPRPIADDTAVIFGSRLTLQAEDRTLTHLRIVGVDELTLAPGNVSWTSPLGKILLSARLGQNIRLSPGAPSLGTLIAVA